MINCKNDFTFNLCLPTNINGLINTLWLVLDHNCKDLGVSKDDIKNKLRGLFLLDFHVFITNKSAIKERRGYWITILTRIMNVYRIYLEDLLESYGCNYIKTFKNTDIDYSMKKLVGIKIEGEVPDIDRAFVYDHDYIMDYVSNGEQTPFFNVYCAIAADALEMYIPRVYGYRMDKLSSVYNRANVNMVLPYPIKKCLETIWRNKELDVKQYLHDIMWEFFDEESIDNFRRYLNNHIGKMPHYGILCNNNENNNILYNDQYTTAGHFSNLTYCLNHVKDFIQACYSCH